MEIPSAFRAFCIEPKDEEEERDQAMPRECAHAMFVFMKSGINAGENAKRCMQCINQALEMLVAGPDGQAKLNIGQACICWGCGHVGIPKNYDDLLKIAATTKTNTNGIPDTLFKRMPPMAICNNCGGPDMTNWVIPKQPDGSIIPWIQRVMAPPEPAKEAVKKPAKEPTKEPTNDN